MPLTQTVERGEVVATADAELVLEQCYKCQCWYALPADLHQRAKEDSKVNFCCPHGHWQGFVKTLREELAQAKQARDRAASNGVFWQDQAGAAERSRRATAGHLTRTKRRIATGTCPCCKRHFVNLERHMTTKHPQYQKSAKGKV